MSSELRRLEELEESGVSFSRNKHFDFWREPDNARLRGLRRYLTSLRSEISYLHGAGRLEMAFDDGGGDDEGRRVLRLVNQELSLRHVTRLSADELDYLARDARVAEAFDTFGLSWR